ncbi:MAG: TonB-dependent receptor [Pseudolabrys sp.]|nr:TonB-dependent receptor [Pseudolabrys sp.]MDP2298986.1 TonB-dependent receptor [Pseudolabrys sp.]
MSARFRRSLLLSFFVLPGGLPAALAQVTLPEVVVSAPSPIQRGTAPATTGDGAFLQGTLPIVTGQFATVTVVPNEEIRRSGAATLGDLLFGKPGITGSSFAPGAASRPIIRGLDVNRVRIQENGIGANGASDLGEDHFVPVDPLTTDRVEVIRGPATLRFGSLAIGGVVEASNNRIPTALPPRGAGAEWRGAFNSADNGLDSAVLLDAGAGNFALHADAFGRSTRDYRVPHYPYLTAPDPADLVNATQPGTFNGRQPNSRTRSDGQSAGGSYIFNDGFAGFSITQHNALYSIPGAEGENENARIDAKQTKLNAKGEWRAPNAVIDAIRYWGGLTDYKHNELGLEDPADPASDTVHQTFTNKEQEGRIEAQLTPFDLRFAALTTAVGVQGGHQKLTAGSPDGIGLWDPNTNRRIAGYIFNEFKFSDTTKAQLAGRIEHVSLSGTGREFDAVGTLTSTPATLGFTPKSASLGLIQNLPMDLVASITAQYVERAPKPAELFSGGAHHASETFDKGNTGLGIETAQSLELGLRRAQGPFRFEATVYYTKFKGFIYRRLTGNTCNGDGDCSVPGEELNEAIYSQADATFRGGEFQSQWDIAPLGSGMFGIESQVDVVRATFSDGSNVPRIPPVRLGGGAYWRDANWLARVRLIHAFAQNDIATAGETTTPGYDDLRAELSYSWKAVKPRVDQLSEVTVGISGSNLLNRDIRSSVSYSKDQVSMPGASVRVFASVRY